MRVRAILALLVLVAAAAFAAFHGRDTAPPDDRLPRPPGSMADLDRFHLIWLGFEGDTAYLVLAERRFFPERYVEVPNRSRNYARWMHLAAIRDGALVRATPFDCIAAVIAHDDEKVASVAAMQLGRDRVRVYVTYRGFRLMWGTDGAIYTFDRETLALRSKEALFVNRNWGWSPVFDGDDILHFSYANGYEYRNGARLEPAQGEVLRKRHVRALRQQSRQLMPGKPEDVLEALRGGGQP